MKKKITAVISTLSLIPCISLPSQAEDFRHGCKLAPISYDETGIKPDSAYILSGCDTEPQLTVNDDITTTVTKQKDGSYLVVPNSQLAYNSLYTFTLEGDEPLSWTFQTANKFCIVNSLPGTNSGNVPRTTGIELTFSHEDFELNEVIKNFSVKPKVNGRWEKHKATAVFVPKDPLSFSTEYTVTVSKDMHRGSEYFDEDYSFSFTTEETSEIGSGSKSNVTPKMRLGSYTAYQEVSTDTIPEISVSVYSGRDTAVKSSITSEFYTLAANDALKYLDNSMSLYEIGDKLNNPTGSISTPVSIDAEEWNNEINIKLPDKLKQGFYMVKSSIDDTCVYSMLQVTDIAAYIVTDKDKYGIWVNDFKSGAPIKGVSIAGDVKKYDVLTDNKGCALIEKGDSKYIKLEKDNKTAYYPLNGSRNFYDIYKSTVITDRALYKESDTVYFWGTARDFDSGEPIKELKAELYNTRYRRYGGEDLPLAKAEVKINENSFDGALQLPKLSAGGYVLRIKNGSKAITETYITVEDYVKPDYKMSISMDKNAIFLGDSVKYTINTAFFEGTALPKLKINWRTSNYAFNNKKGEAVSDADGNAAVSVTPELSDNGKNFQRESDLNISAYATLPETGDISTQASARVFLNNVTSDTKSEYKNGTTTVDIHMDTITLDRLNDGTAKSWNDYIDKPDASRDVKIELVYNYYNKVQEGWSYNYISKQNEPVYRYTVEQKITDTKNLKTDSEGNIRYEFKPQDKEEGWYTINLFCTDDMGREYSTSSWIQTREYKWRGYDYYDGDQYEVLTDKERYNIGDEAVITIMHGTKPAEENILYIKDCNGIKEMGVTDNGEYRTVFSQTPGFYIDCVAFVPSEGYRRINYYTYLPYDYEQSRLDISIKTDKESYAPGETAELEINVKNKDGAAAEADICVNLVDEALLALRDNSEDILSEIYSYLPIMTRGIYKSHQPYYGYASVMRGGGGGGMVTSGSYAAANKMMDMAESEAASDMAVAGMENGAAVRSDFRDTAVFLTARTDKNGYAKVECKLPDNITSWRAAVNAVTEQLGAGAGTCPVNVTLPAFISYNMSDSYITGDTPIVGVNLYGSGLDSADTAEFVIDDGENKYTASGHPFERVNIPISTMNTEGKKSITVRASVNGKEIDALKSEFEVVNTYNTTDTTTYYNTPYDAINPGDGHNVDIVFTDKNRAALLNNIYHMRYMFGNRLDQRISQLTAIGLLNDYYNISIPACKTEWKNYQSEDGGMKLFTYGNSDIDATAKLTPYIKDKVDKYALTQYLNANKNDIKALYALACLREPILRELEKYAAAENLKPSEYLYIALAYCELGEYGKAEEIWNSRIEQRVEETTPHKRVRAGTDNDDILEATALAAVTALYIGRDDAEQFYGYCERNYTNDILINIEELMYISTAAKMLPQEKGTVKYSLFGEEHTKEFCGREAHRITVPAQNLSEFKVLEASDSVRMMSVATAVMPVDKLDNQDVRITRKYSAAGKNESMSEFAETDIVKVTIRLDYGKQLENGSYVINDYLPSGLRLIDNNLRGADGNWAISADGQRVTLCAYNGLKDDHDEVTYYARVVNPGTYTADNAILQNGKSKDIIAATDKAVITIK